MSIETALVKSPVKGKKYRMLFFKDGEYWKKTDFGATGYEDFTTHKDEERKKRYLARHRANENWDDPYSAGSLSKNILWNQTSIKKSYQD